jgi:hypothetical protein
LENERKKICQTALPEQKKNPTFFTNERKYQGNNETQFLFFTRGREKNNNNRCCFERDSRRQLPDLLLVERKKKFLLFGFFPRNRSL